MPDIAMGQSLGMRERQEDRIGLCPRTGEPTVLVLSDGMGGAVGGDLAAELILENVIQACEEGPAPAAGVFRAAAHRANRAIRAYVHNEPDMEGMGGTLLCVRLYAQGIMFFSMGDSPLIHVRDGLARRLNADHSVGGMLDAAVARGEMSPDDARGRRDRNTITSFLAGVPIEEMRMDETADLVPMTRGDVVILASDGLDTLQPDQVAHAVAGADSSSAIVDALLAAVEAAAKLRQDNTSVIVVRW